MTNDFYNHSTPLTKHTLARAEVVNAEFDAIAAGLDKLPTEAELKLGTALYAADTGTANAITVSMPHTITSYTEGMGVSVKKLLANTGATTINIDGVGAKQVLTYNGSALSAGDIPAGAIAHLRYDGSSFRLIGPSQSVADSAAASATAAASSASFAAASAATATTQSSGAAASASTATTQASAAAAAAATATTQATNAGNSATSAAASATTAGSNAADAANAAISAAASATTASNAATTATTQATNAATSASTATTQATNASNSATSAASSANTASTAATTASNSATAAASSAAAAAASAAALPNASSIGSGKVPQSNGTSWTGVTLPTGTVTSIVAGTGLTGGTITSSGTIAVDVGTTASKIVQLDGSARLPAVDGSQLTGISSTDQIGLDFTALTAARLMYTTSISDGSLGQGYQWELSSNTWSSSSTNAVYTSATPCYYTNQGGTPSYANAGGTGDRRGSITVTVAGAWANSTPANFVDGTLDSTNAFTNGNNASTYSVTFDFGSGASKVVTEVVWKQSTTATHGTWKLQGSNNGSSWTDVGASFTLGGSTAQTITAPSSNTTGYRYYKLVGVSGTVSGAPWLQEVEFKIADAPIGVLDTTLIPPSSVSVASAPTVIDCRFLWKDDSGSAALGTDLTVDLSRDGGTTWTAATISTIGAFDATYSYIKARATVSGQPSGTSMLCRIKALNGKAQRVGLPSINKEY